MSETPEVDPLAVLPVAHGPSDPYARTEETFPRLTDDQGVDGRVAG